LILLEGLGGSIHGRTLQQPLGCAFEQQQSQQVSCSLERKQMPRQCAASRTVHSRQHRLLWTDGGLPYINHSNSWPGTSSRFQATNGSTSFMSERNLVDGHVLLLAALLLG
jgi:hypothetical protein